MLQDAHVPPRRSPFDSARLISHSKLLPILFFILLLFLFFHELLLFMPFPLPRSRRVTHPFHLYGASSPHWKPENLQFVSGFINFFFGVGALFVYPKVPSTGEEQENKRTIAYTSYVTFITDGPIELGGDCYNGLKKVVHQNNCPGLWSTLLSQPLKIH